MSAQPECAAAEEEEKEDVTLKECKRLYGAAAVPVGIWRRMSGPERELYAQIQMMPGLAIEYRFAPPRRWRFDFAFPAARVAVEVEGGTWSGGRHVRGAGFEADCEKYNRAALLGWRVLRFTPEMIRGQVALRMIGLALGGEPTKKQP